jgi:membrane protein YdbS with pleckstrin-like domain
MSFPRRLLTQGEEVVIDLRPHWAFLGWPLVASIAALALAVGVDVAFSGLPSAALDILLVVVAVALLWLAGRAVRWVTTSIALTNTRVVERSGVLGRRALEIRLERINELSYHQSLLGWLFRTGEVMVEMGGETGVVTFDHVPRPAAFQSLITEQISARHDGRSTGQQPPGFVTGDRWGRAGSPSAHDTPPTGSPAVAGTNPAEVGGQPSVADRLLQLGELRRRGIVSAEEFEAKKAELLKQL